MSIAAWQGPPGGILGRPLPLTPFVARSGNALVALQQVLAFPEGCLFTVRIAARRGALSESRWERLVGSLSGQHPADGPDDLKLGVRLPGGATATVAGNAFPGWGHRTDRPDPPMLVAAGGGSTGDDGLIESDRQLWLWPLPPAGPFAFVAEWRELGLDLTSGTLDGTAIARAAEQAQPYWS